MLTLSKSGDRIKIRCSCTMYSLVFRDRDLNVNRPIRCLSCGSTAEYDALLAASRDKVSTTAAA